MEYHRVPEEKNQRNSAQPAKTRENNHKIDLEYTSLRESENKDVQVLISLEGGRTKATTEARTASLRTLIKRNLHLTNTDLKNLRCLVNGKDQPLDISLKEANVTADSEIQVIARAKGGARHTQCHFDTTCENQECSRNHTRDWLRKYKRKEEEGKPADKN